MSRFFLTPSRALWKVKYERNLGNTWMYQSAERFDSNSKVFLLLQRNCTCFFWTNRVSCKENSQASETFDSIADWTSSFLARTSSGKTMVLIKSRHFLGRGRFLLKILLSEISISSEASMRWIYRHWWENTSLVRSFNEKNWFSFNDLF